MDKDNNIYVDTGCKVMIFSSAGDYLGSLGTGCGTGGYESGWLTGVAVDDNGNIYVADWPNHRVMAYNSAKTFIGQIGGTGECSTANDHRLVYNIDVYIQVIVPSYVRNSTVSLASFTL